MTLLGALRDNVAKRDEFYIRQFGKAGEMLSIGDTAASNDADSYFLSHNDP